MYYGFYFSKVIVTKFSGRVSDSDSSSSCFLRRKEDDEADDRSANGESGLSSKRVAADISASIIWPKKADYFKNL